MAQEEVTTLQWGPYERRLKLTELQKSLLHPENSDPRVVITGPPGCGKTTALVLKGLQWLQAGHDVIVFGLHALGFPACRLVYCLLSEAHKKSQGPLFPKDRTWGRVLFEHHIVGDARELEPALRTVLKYGERPRILMDDFSPDDGFHIEMMLVFMRQLRERAPDLHLWATNLFSKIPEGFTVHVLTEPTRYPIHLMQEVKIAVEVLKGTEILPDTHGFSYVTDPLARHEPDVIHLRHNGRGEEKWPLNSEKCGRMVAKALKAIGVRETADTSSEGGKYTFRDVLIVSRCPQPGLMAFVWGLQTSGISAGFFGTRGPGFNLQNRQHMEQAFDDFILGKENKVIVMNYTAARGLDRPVVVCLTGAAPGEHYELTPQDLTGLLEDRKSATRRLKSCLEVAHRLELWSRAYEQLIVVHLPKGMEAGPSGTDNYGGRKCVIL